ncbi:MAG TPA: ABC transporter permease [Candidatus Limnocylindrales bacterium]|nr:ABC transporter permease [Candidatus Limnocylindrales bacterium]
MSRRDPILPNAGIVARREYAERVGSRLFHLSTLLLATLGVVVALSPLIVRMLDRDTVTRIGVVASDGPLVDRSISILDGVLNATATGGPRAYEFSREANADPALQKVVDGDLDALLVATRQPSGRIDFKFHAGENMGADRTQLVSIGTLAVAILDWTASQKIEAGNPFTMPQLDVTAAGGPSSGGQPISSAEYASRRVVGIVFVVLIFITLVIYGMWVAAGVVAEKASRVMEVMISAASPQQLVIGKVAGIGLAGLTQAVGILAPAVAAIALEDRIAGAVLGPGSSVAPSLAGLSIGLLAAFLAYFVLGFVLYALIYAAAGSLVSRAEDLQMLALPLSLLAIVGYVQAVMALTGGSAGFIRVASYVPFWSPFVMLTRLSVGRVEPWEVVLSFSLLVAAIGVVFVVAVRVYAAGVLLYGQRPGLRTIAAVVVGSR